MQNKNSNDESKKENKETHNNHTIVAMTSMEAGDGSNTEIKIKTVQKIEYKTVIKAKEMSDEDLLFVFDGALREVFVLLDMCYATYARQEKDIQKFRKANAEHQKRISYLSHSKKQSFF